MRNPFITTILALLQERTEGIREFDILQALKNQYPEFNQLAEDPNLQLFRQHFLIMNALYQLQKNLWEEDQISLSIHALAIKILPKPETKLAEGSALIDTADARLSEYYLDWGEYEKTDEAEVERLIDSFFKRMALVDNKQQALETLNITSPSPSQQEIKQQYRRLAKEHHPDAGGDAANFIKIRHAYEQLIL